MQKKGYDCECLGGGRISHQSQDRKIHVYGYSMVSLLALPAACPALTRSHCCLSCGTALRGLECPVSRGTRDRKHMGWEGGHCLPLTCPGLSPLPTPRGLAGLLLSQLFEAVSIGVKLRGPTLCIHQVKPPMDTQGHSLGT